MRQVGYYKELVAKPLCIVFHIVLITLDFLDPPPPQ